MLPAAEAKPNPLAIWVRDWASAGVAAPAASVAASEMATAIEVLAVAGGGRIVRKTRRNDHSS
jgi:hypothetical protein